MDNSMDHSTGARKDEKSMITLEEAAQMLSISRPTLYRWMRINGFPAIKIGGCVRIPVEELRRWAADQVRGDKGSD